MCVLPVEVRIFTPSSSVSREGGKSQPFIRGKLGWALP
jgi:hypothetical protein